MRSFVLEYSLVSRVLAKAALVNSLGSRVFLNCPAYMGRFWIADSSDWSPFGVDDEVYVGDLSQCCEGSESDEYRDRSCIIGEIEIFPDLGIAEQFSETAV